MALGIEIDSRPFAKSTLQMFRAQLILHERVGEIFRRSLQFARDSGYLRGHRMRVALDTTNILGRGAVKDTYNLLADGIVGLLRALAAVDGTEAVVDQRYDRYRGTSLKGEADIDWADATERAGVPGRGRLRCGPAAGIGAAGAGAIRPGELRAPATCGCGPVAGAAAAAGRGADGGGTGPGRTG